jgi:hypothetical protein
VAVGVRCFVGKVFDVAVEELAPSWGAGNVALAVGRGALAAG